MLQIEQVDQGKRFLLKQKPVSFMIQLILVLLTDLTLLVPIIILLTPNPGKGAIYGAMLCAFLSLYLIRMCLWNLFGMEVFELSEDEFLHYTDYRLFKDELYRVENLVGLEWGSAPAEKGEGFYLVLQKAGKEVTRSSIPLDSLELEALLKQLDC